MDYAETLSIPYRERLRDIVPSPTLNLVGGKICSDIENKLGSDATVLIIGCGEGGEGISEFSDCYRKNNIIGIDIRVTDFIDIRGDIHNLPIKSESADAVICQATLEHVRKIDQALQELVEIVKEGGYLYIDVPFIQGSHALPTDYRRYTSRGLEVEIKNKGDMETLELGTSKGPTSSIVWILCEYFSFIFSFGNYRVRKILSVGIRIFIFWVKHIDKILLKTHGFNNDSMSIPSAVYWYGQKK
jgi:SAM-dependent methyltransferase